jgi:predicted dehydrogenase
MGLVNRGERCRGCPARQACCFYLDLAAHRSLKEMYLDCEAEDGYFRDRCVFSGDINIWDTMSLSVRYRRGAVMSYMLHAYSPYEGYRIAFNGTRGRLEHHCCENSYISGDDSIPGELKPGNVSITLAPAFSQPRQLDVSSGAGGHGGGDSRLLVDVFDRTERPADPLRRKAGIRDGTYSIMTGVAAYHSIDKGRPVCISRLLGKLAPG